MTRKKEAEETFAALMADGGLTPEGVLVAVLRGQATVTKGRKSKRITKDMVQAAKDLLPYRLPKLNNIDAQVKNVEMTHEQWLTSLDNDEAEGNDNG